MQHLNSSSPDNMSTSLLECIGLLGIGWCLQPMSLLGIFYKTESSFIRTSGDFDL